MLPPASFQLRGEQRCVSSFSGRAFLFLEEIAFHTPASFATGDEGRVQTRTATISLGWRAGVGRIDSAYEPQ